MFKIKILANKVFVSHHHVLEEVRLSHEDRQQSLRRSTFIQKLVNGYKPAIYHKGALT
jgi:hypothetical protein